MTDSTLYKTALTKAMALCSGREYCIDDIRSKLQRWSVEENDAEKIISALIKENFINEKRYAEAFVRDKFRYNKWGKVKIRAGLRFRNIPADIINAALDCVDHTEYQNTIRVLLDAHRRSVKAKNQYDLKGKLLRYGLSKGFESDLLYDILSGEFKDPDQERHKSDQEDC
jgi:regulatory protein